MNNIRQHDPAFPLSMEQAKLRDEGFYYQEGLTKLEYASIMAMQGLLANSDLSGEPSYGAFARDSIKYAKALFEELEKESK